MKKNIVIIGSGPLPNDTIGIREAGGLRTHQFTKAIAHTGHNITLVCIHNNDNFTEQIKKDNTDKTNSPIYHNTSIIRVHRHDKNLKDAIPVDNIDIIFGVNTFPSFIASQICPPNIPLWTDLNGWIMAESQARGYTEQTNIHFANAWRQEKYILDKADRISTVSTAQKFCTLGEMASTGNILYQNFHEELVFAIPNTTEFFSTDTPHKSDTFDKHDTTKPLFRGNKIPHDAITISHIGGYNNWVDTSTLFYAIDNAMSLLPHLYFISTGGAIKDVSNKAFSDFLDKIDTSKYKDRYVFLGWIPTKDMYKVYTESDIGINVDFACIETETGARNRLNEMIKFQLPIITTKGSEIAETIGQYKAGECVPNGNINALTDSIVKMATLAKESKLTTYKQQCAFIQNSVYNPKTVMQPVLDFINTPIIRNKTKTQQDSPFSLLKNTIWYMKRNGIRQTFHKIIQQFFS